MIRAVILVVSPTRLLYEILKRPAGKLSPDMLTSFARSWPLRLITVELLLVSTLAVATAASNWRLQYPLIVIPVGWFALSRIVEIAYAYYKDAIDTLEGREKTTALTRADRIRHAVKSYGSLLLDWSILYFLLPVAAFKPEFATFIDALYFSGVTITTLGYGDIVPVFPGVRLLCVAEALLGVLVLVVALGSYLTIGTGSTAAKS
jgi:hypothetical protein